MFHTFKQRLFLGIFIFILLSIPMGAYIASQFQTIETDTKDENTKKQTVKTTPKPTASPAKTSPAKQLLDSSADLTPTPEPTPSLTPAVTASFGPTLSLKVTLEGRSQENQATKLFVGIVEGVLAQNPRFLLSFTVDLPSSGQYSGLSLAGLNPGSRYSTLLKGSAQIATSSSFLMSPTVTNLNEGQPVTLLSGDLNDDNIINSADYSIAKKAISATNNSSNWNENADLNKDGVINGFDLAIITKNIGRSGASGAWTSPLPQLATPSAGLTEPAVGSPSGAPTPDSEGGYWLWIPSR